MASPNRSYEADQPAPGGTADQYTDAIIELMAQGTRGVVMFNMVVPERIPPLARIPGSVIAAAGFAGVQAFRSLWDGAMGRPLVQPKYRGPFEEVVSTALVSSAVGTSGSLAIGRTVPRALRMGGKIGAAVFAGEAAAESVRQFAYATRDGALGARAREMFGSMQAAGIEHFGTAATAVNEVVSATRTRVRDFGVATATSIGAAAEATRSGVSSAAASVRNVDLGSAARGTADAVTGAAGSAAGAVGDAMEETRLRVQELRESIFGAPAETNRRERPMPRQGPRAAVDIPSPPRISLAGRQASSGDAFVDGFWRTRRIPGSGRTVREHVRGHRRDA